MALCLLVVTLLSACQYARSPTDFYMYYNNRTINTDRKNGLFYILEEPVSSQWEHGTIEVQSCYSNGLFVVLTCMVETDDATGIDALIGQYDSWIYPEVYVNNKKGTASSFGCRKLNPEEPGNTGRYLLTMGYDAKAYKIKEPLRLVFVDAKIELPLVPFPGNPSLDAVQSSVTNPD